MTVSFVILGAPRTKGNHAVIARNARRPVLIPSPQYRAWFKHALQQLPLVRRAIGRPLPILGPVEVTAIWFRARNAGDEDNFKKGLGDFLQRARIIENDRQIHWGGGTRLDKDPVRPRVEVSIVEVAR